MMQQFMTTKEKIKNNNLLIIKNMAAAFIINFTVNQNLTGSTPTLTVSTPPPVPNVSTQPDSLLTAFMTTIKSFSASQTAAFNALLNPPFAVSSTTTMTAINTSVTAATGSLSGAGLYLLNQVLTPLNTDITTAIAAIAAAVTLPATTTALNQLLVLVTLFKKAFDDAMTSTNKITTGIPQAGTKPKGTPIARNPPSNISGLSGLISQIIPHLQTFATNSGTIATGITQITNTLTKSHCGPCFQCC